MRSEEGEEVCCRQNLMKSGRLQGFAAFTGSLVYWVVPTSNRLALSSADLASFVSSCLRCG